MIDERLALLARASACWWLVDAGEMDLDEAWGFLREAFLKIPSEFLLLEKACERDVTF